MNLPLALMVAFCMFGRSDLNAVSGSKTNIQFEQDVKPILADHCFGCHSDGANEGSMSFDELLAAENAEEANEKWYRVLNQLQAGLMPPADEERPSPEQVETIRNWIKYGQFGLDPMDPDPGRVTVRRLNLVEYRNTIRDLISVDYDTSSNFPADDTGHGFDNIADVLSLSPLLFEKYVNAAEEIVSSVVPVVSGIVRVNTLAGEEFKLDRNSVNESVRNIDSPTTDAGNTELSYYEEATARAKLNVQQTGDHVLRLNIVAKETFVSDQFDENKCEFSFSIGNDVLIKREFVRQGNKDFSFDFDQTLEAGEHELIASMKPLSDNRRIRSLRIQIKSVDLIGPKDERYFAKPNGYERFFPRNVPVGAKERREYAGELLERFASRAFRRPIDEENMIRLVDLAESVFGVGGATFEAGISKSMTAILASPRFLFREERPLANSSDRFPLIDEYSLASRLSYFLWSSMPDEELTHLANANQLRNNLDQQIDRMLKDEKGRAFSENFVGQWLRARAIDTIQISSRDVLNREPKNSAPDADIRRKRFFELFRKGDDRTEEEDKEFENEREEFRRSFDGGPRFSLTPEIRHAMRRETEMLFEHIVRNDGSLLEMVDSDYTFLNEALWGHYQIAGIGKIEGDQMRLVNLPTDSLRGGVLTQGTFLAVTSNPDRTSPVKRGLFILENLLGTPPAAPPPNIPALEDVAPDSDKKLSLRETLAIHRKNDLCSSCHNRMDPLGLALENFNALGRLRTVELDQPIDASGELASGEAFASINELKKILVTDRKLDLYRCITEKMMTYALGRAVEYTDAHTMDELVARLEASNGKASELIYGIIHSSAFQRTRR